MAPPRTLALVLAGGAGSRLGLLTEDRAKPVVPYGGAYRLIDVPLSCCTHSGIGDVWVVQQQHPASLADSLANGRPWDLDRTHGGLLVLPPGRGTQREGWHRGTADALWKQAELVRDFAPDVLLVLSADAVYRMDYADVVDRHLGSGAGVTMVTTRVPAREAGRFGVVEAGRDGTVRRYRYKPDRPATDVVATEVFAFDPGSVLDDLERLARDAGDGDELGDLGDDLLPRLAEQGRAREHRFTGYWRDVGTVDSYWSSHMDLLGARPAFDLDDARRPVLSSRHRLPPARVRSGAQVADCLLSPGCEVAGRVERSVLSPGVVVERGALVQRSVLLPGAVVRRGAEVTRAVLDSDVTVGRDARVGDARGGVAVVGRRYRLRRGATVPAGRQHPRPRDAD